jgi:hypothetical protein
MTPLMNFRRTVPGDLPMACLCAAASARTTAEALRDWRAPPAAPHTT